MADYKMRAEGYGSVASSPGAPPTMTHQEFTQTVARIRSQHMQLQDQQRMAESEVEKAAIQEKMDALMIEFREAQRLSLGERAAAMKA